MYNKKAKIEKEPKPVLVSVVVKDTILNVSIPFPPTRAGEKSAERYRYLAGMEIIKTYEKGGKRYECN